jgi:hypothetical protein
MDQNVEVEKGLFWNWPVACPPNFGPVLMGIVKLAESQAETHTKTTHPGPDGQEADAVARGFREVVS